METKAMRKADCRLCSRPAFGFYAEAAGSRILYYRCATCGYVFKPRSALPTKAMAKARYLEHNNSLDDTGYRAYLETFIDTTSIPFYPSGSDILDFGSGPKPCLAELLRARGLPCWHYDPIFAPGSGWKRRTYGLIVLHEVAEHLVEPEATLKMLSSLLLPGGAIAIRTRFLPDGEREFGTWWYRMDITHVGFFSPQSLMALFALSGLETLSIEAPDAAVARRSL